ncbi:uncharacterized protein LOC134699280 [Mytilus trossulus]|uniref:uncharacterized protein LOC134699280 n=1 Tax=Mytilus trossulus TaxID=6551 RepID=UPI003006CEF7
MKSRMAEFSQFKRILETCVQQNHDPASVYQRWHADLTNDMISTFRNSPTAQKYKTAHEMFKKGQSILCRYTKPKVDTDDDCDFLQPAFHSYAYGEMSDTIWFGEFRPPKNASDLLDQYLKHRPEDVLSEYCKTIFAYRSEIDEQNESALSKFNHLHIAIRTTEVFAMKVREATTTSNIKHQILSKLYNTLGSFYAITDQGFRAVDSFQKAYDTDNNDYDSLFGVAWWQKEENPDEAINLFHKYLDVAPECDKKYYDAFYSLAVIYLTSKRDIPKFKEYYNKAQDAEKKQLPFYPPYDTSSRQCANMMMEVCNNMFMRKQLHN